MWMNDEPRPHVLSMEAYSVESTEENPVDYC